MGALEIVAVGAVLLLAAIYAVYTHRPSFEYLKGREPDQSLWEIEYSKEMPRVLEILRLVCKALLLRDDDVYRLRPNDRVLAIYKAAYPHGGPDSLELESLATEVRRRYHVDVTALWGSLSIRQIVDACLGASNDAV